MSDFRAGWYGVQTGAGPAVERGGSTLEGAMKNWSDALWDQLQKGHAGIAA